jgi:hypothetical protein
MALGIDTFRTHLDLIGWNLFKSLNGGQSTNDQVAGGEPDFAGRNFLGGDFLWGHGEATDALDHPSPEHLETLNLLTPLIAPIQAPQTARQQRMGQFGHLHGRIDGDALCNRLAAGIVAGEFVLPAGGLVHVWLSVDPAVDLSVDYWSGWSDQVNNFAFFLITDTPRVAQPFRACILCSFLPGADGKLRPDPHVTATLLASRSSYPGGNTTCYACWSDAPANPPLDWSLFDGGPKPLLWRFSHGLRNDAGTVINDLFDVDAANPGAGLPKAADSMLVTQRWQPNVPAIANYGFISNQQKGITDAQITKIQANPFPALTDLKPHYHLPGGRVTEIGRYLKPSVLPKGDFVMSRDEATRISSAGFHVFTIWENPNALAGREPTDIAYFDAASHAGTEDGTDAFTYCGDTLGQPSQTPIFFCVDFDAADSADGLTKVNDYFTLVKNARDAYALKNPDRYFLIGVYGNGAVNRSCYEQGIVSVFWQSVSPGGTGNTLPGEFPWSAPLPLRPFCHANRWQFTKESALEAAGWKFVLGSDPDADWGDGGTWSLASPLVADFETFLQTTIALAHGAKFGMWGNLVLPPLP